MKLCPICSEVFPDDAAFCPFDASELKKSADPFLGRTLAARYRLVKRIGSGGMSLVYLARHVMIDRLSALKILRQDFGLDPVHRERFLREARAVNRINHRNIIEITDFGESDGLVFLVMEYIDGDSLHVHMKRGRFPWARAAKIGLQVASALGRAHQMGVIHRDLKPENVLLVPVDGEEIVKLTDFGIAKISDAPALTFNQQTLGTPGYIAPEYLEGLPPDGRADLYALGVLLYEMITQALPFDARAPADLLVLPLNSAPVPPSTRVEGLPPDLEALLLRLLARRAEDRPRDAFEVHDGLLDILRRFSMPPGSAKTSGKWAPAIVRGQDDQDEMTIDDSVRHPSVEPPTGERQTQDLVSVPTIEIASRWHAALAELDAAIARAKKRGGRHVEAANRAAALVDNARTMVASIERAASRVSEHQARVDRLDAKGRAFRGNLGHALDQLVRERSRERAHASAIDSRRAFLAGSRGEPAAAAEKTAEMPAMVAAPDAGGEAAVWEAAALDAEDARARAVDEDLTFQVDALQKQLDHENEELDQQLAEATGALEGSLAALRLLNSEIVRTLDESAAAVSEVRRGGR